MKRRVPNIKMLDYMLDHEAAITAALGNKRSDEDQLQALLHEHDLKLTWFQHERLIHLLIMIVCIVIFMIAFCLMLFLEMLLLFILTLVLGVLSAAYIFHYFRLENTVQRGYLLRDRISQRILAQRLEQAEPAKQQSAVNARQMIQKNRPPVS